MATVPALSNTVPYGISPLNGAWCHQPSPLHAGPRRHGETAHEVCIVVMETRWFLRFRRSSRFTCAALPRLSSDQFPSTLRRSVGRRHDFAVMLLISKEQRARHWNDQQNVSGGHVFGHGDRAFRRIFPRQVSITLDKLFVAAARRNARDHR